MTYFEQLYEKTIDDSGICFMDKYPLKCYDIYIFGPCAVKNGVSLLRDVPEGYEEAIKLNIDEDKCLISYIDYKTKTPFYSLYEDSFKCWFSTGSMLCQGTVYVCRKESEVNKLLSLVSDEELMEEMLRRLMTKAENKIKNKIVKVEAK